VATKKPKKDEMVLQMTGNVYLVDRKPGRKDVKHKIDGKLVLAVVLTAIMKGLDLVEERSRG